MITLRDMGLRPKILVEACRDAGVKMNKERASRIINGLTVIKPEEMEVISKILDKTVDELYVKLGSHFMDMSCPVIKMFYVIDSMCISYLCPLWDEHVGWCRFLGPKP